MWSWFGEQDGPAGWIIAKDHQQEKITSRISGVYYSDKDEHD
jgi:hypothetical protein